MSDPIKNQTAVFLKLNNYVAIAYGGVWYWFPTYGKAKTQLVLSFDANELYDGAYVKILTCETKVGDQRVLGAFKDAHECYYWTDTQGTKQSWKVTAQTPQKDNKIHYGDKILLTNDYWVQNLVTTDDNYLTTKKDEQCYWTFEKAPGVSDDIPNQPKYGKPLPNR